MWFSKSSSRPNLHRKILEMAVSRIEPVDSYLAVRHDDQSTKEENNKRKLPNKEITRIYIYIYIYI